MIITFLTNRQLLLVLDSCEHVLDEIAPLVSDILRVCPQVAVLATSRTTLQVAGELVWPVAPLTVPGVEVRTLAEIGDYEAVQLFALRAQQRVREYRLTESSAGAVAELCRRLDGLPLAIELAAARMSSLSPSDLVDRLQWRFELLQDQTSQPDPRHRNLRALIDWSFDLLDPGVQELFEVLSVFAGPFTLGDAENLVSAIEARSRWEAAEVVSGIATLVEQSMIVASHGWLTTYMLLDTLREYGWSRLSRRSYAPAVQREHAKYYASVAARTYGHLFGADQLKDAATLERAMSEFRLAHRWALECDLDLASELVGSLNILAEQKMLAEVFAWADAVVAQLGGASRRVTHAARAYAIAAAGARFAGDLDRAQALCTAGIRLAGADVACHRYLRFLQTEVAFFRGEMNQLMLQLQAAEALPAQNDDQHPGLSAIIEACRLLLLIYHGDPHSAAQQAVQLQVAAERQGWPTMTAWAQYIRGEAMADLAPDQSDALLSSALRRAKEMDERYLAGVAVVSLASVRSRHGDPHAAVALFSDVVRHWRDRGDWLHQWTTLRNVADLLLRLHRYEAAAILTAGLQSRGGMAVGYGSDSARLAQTWTTLTAELEPQAVAELDNIGRSMNDSELVSFALDALANPARGAQSSPTSSLNRWGHRSR